MSFGTEHWNVSDASDWGRVLGLVPVPLFGEDKEVLQTHGNVLLDGQRASFTLFVTDDSRDLLGTEPLSWSWSASLNHTLIADVQKDLLLLKRWDVPESVRRFRLPRTPRAASQLFDIIRQDAEVANSDVILHLLRAFRSIREAVRTSDNTHDSVRLFNTFLLGAKAVTDQAVTYVDFMSQKTVGNVIKLLESLPDGYSTLLEACGAHDLPNTVLAIPPGIFASRFLDVEPQFQYTLDANLLMRHASGQLYQEAHISLDRQSPQQSLFPGIEEGHARTTPPARSDVRFTPVALARTLVQQAFDACNDFSARDELEILDPACGSGVFLVQAVQELVNRGYKGKIKLRGIDLSPLSCSMARFCLEHSRQDAANKGLQINCEITIADALSQSWSTPDIVLMNPPFVHLDRMSPDEKATVSQVLGSLDMGRGDKAMAFAWKAFQSIAPGGVVATVLPAPLLETRAGEQWRQVLARDAEITLLGCFRGFGYFKGAKVEPAFLVRAYAS